MANPNNVVKNYLNSAPSMLVDLEEDWGTDLWGAERRLDELKAENKVSKRYARLSMASSRGHSRTTYVVRGYVKNS